MTEAGAPVGTNLPPIHRVKEPAMHHMSTRIRWFYALGYKVGEIHHFLGVRYQQVRNVVTTVPKRMAREDLPPLTVEVLDLETDLEAMEAQALMEQMAAQREQERGDKKVAAKARRHRRNSTADSAGDEPEVDEITEQEG